MKKSKAIGKTSKQKIYCLSIDGDGGEVWLNNDKKVIGQVHCNDGQFREEYHSFIFDALNVEFIRKYITLKEKLYEAVSDNFGDDEKIQELLAAEIKKLK